MVQACFPESTDDLLNLIPSTYTEWRNNTHGSHLSIYFNMNVRRYLWLNGYDGTRLEFLTLPGANGSINTDTGFGRMYDEVVRHKIRQLMTVEYYG